jgi:triosephosphate isomerase (TIM)
MKTLIVCNWKMNPAKLREASTLAKGIEKEAKKYSSLSVIIAPPMLQIPIVRSSVKKIALGAQDVSAYREGAHTGEVSATMLANVGVKFVIVGHSERRAQGETNEATNLKIKEILQAKLSPILCIGEKVRDESVWYMHEIKTQLAEALVGITKKQLSSLVIAYEPVWAIGGDAKREATPMECEEVVIYIRKILADLYDVKNANAVPILFGGSVSEKNADLFIAQGRASGLLVGRASVSIVSFRALLARVAMVVGK